GRVVRCEHRTWLGGETLLDWSRGRWLAKWTEGGGVKRIPFGVTRRTVVIHHVLALHIGQNPRPSSFDAIKRSLRRGLIMRQRPDGLCQQAQAAVGDHSEDSLTGLPGRNARGTST